MGVFRRSTPRAWNGGTRGTAGGTGVEQVDRREPEQPETPGLEPFRRVEQAVEQDRNRLFHRGHPGGPAWNTPGNPSRNLGA